MNLLQEVRPGVNRYVSGDNVLIDLQNYLTPFKKIKVITGTISYHIFKHYYNNELPYPIFFYDGSSSDEDSDRLSNELKEADVIVAIGGGRVLDTAKLTAEQLDCELIMIPTLISNCAPYTPVAAVYHTDHTFKRIGGFTRSGFLTLVDWQLLLSTPKEYLIAGIGDTLAKWYEIESIVRHLSDDQKSAAIRLSIACAKELFAILLKDAEQALKDLDSQTVTPTFGRIADTIIAIAGTIGGFAGESGRTAGAHAIHNGMSLLTETYSILHGSKVAYGVLVQLSYTGDFTEIDKLLPFYKVLALPTSLTELNLPTFDYEKLKPMATFAASPSESFILIDPEVNAEKILAAIKKLEDFVAQSKEV